MHISSISDVFFSISSRFRIKDSSVCKKISGNFQAWKNLWLSSQFQRGWHYSRPQKVDCSPDWNSLAKDIFEKMVCLISIRGFDRSGFSCCNLQLVKRINDDKNRKSAQERRNKKKRKWNSNAHFVDINNNHINEKNRHQTHHKINSDDMVMKSLHSLLLAW